MESTKQQGLYKKRRKLYTKNLTPKKTFFEQERTTFYQGAEYRELDPNRSKFAAAVMKGLQQTGLTKDAKVLYLGASHGFTPSFFSDIVPQGMIFCLDFAPRVVRDLYFVCEQRNNMAPIMADAKQPDAYKKLVPQVDVVFQDIAQKGQLEIFIKNCDTFLKQGGFGMMALKARSMNVTAKPKDLFKQVRKELEDNKNYVIVDYRELDPFEKDHAYFTIKKK